MDIVRGGSPPPSGRVQVVWVLPCPAFVAGESGFTLIELLMVTAVIAVLVSMAVPSYNQLQDKAKVARCKQEVRSIETEINAYFVDRNAYPASLADIHRDDTRDPWGHLYRYSYPGVRTAVITLNPMTYDLYSLGEDGQTDDDLLEPISLDDIVRAADGGFVGLGSEF